MNIEVLNNVVRLYDSKEAIESINAKLVDYSKGEVIETKHRKEVIEASILYSGVTSEVIKNEDYLNKHFTQAEIATIIKLSTDIKDCGTATKTMSEQEFIRDIVSERRLYIQNAFITTERIVYSDLYDLMQEKYLGKYSNIDRILNDEKQFKEIYYKSFI